MNANCGGSRRSTPGLWSTSPLYCYATGTRSSRKIMRRCRTDVACRIIVGEDVPDFLNHITPTSAGSTWLDWRASSSTCSSCVPWLG